MSEMSSGTLEQYYFADSLSQFLNQTPAVSEWTGPVAHECEQMNARIWLIRYTNREENFVLKIYYAVRTEQYEAQVRIDGLMIGGALKGHGISKAIINYLVDFCKPRQATVWITDVINRDWKMYLLSQGAQLLQEETRESGAILYIPEKIGLKKTRQRRYVDEFDRELINYVIQFLTLEGVEIRDIRSAKASELIYDIRILIDGFVLAFQYEKASQAGEAQIRFDLRLDQSYAGTQTIPVAMLTNMLNVLLLYCRVHGSMTLWMFNAQIFGADFVNYFIQCGAKLMREDPSGFRGGTVLTFDKKLL